VGTQTVSAGSERITGWWRSRGQVERFDLYTRVPLYLLSGLAPLLLLGGLLSEPDAPPGPVAAVLAVGVVHTVVCLMLLHRGLLRARTPESPAAPPYRLIALGAGLTLAGVWVGWATGLGTGNRWFVVALAFTLAFVAALSVVVSLWATLAVLVLALVLGAVIQVPEATGDTRVAWIISLVSASTGVFAGYRGSVWMLGIVWELDRARAVQARLAVAEERLRFSRELHDVVGRGLAVIALKSELAAQLAKRGRAETANEMLQVRQVAQDLLLEVRQVVRGYRMVDLDAELAGARAVLESAGVDCQVIGERGDLPVDAQGSLGWVVREGTTNVIRHSDARTCTVSLHREDDGAVVLAMENDGVREPEAPLSGSGLVGLTERLALVGGTVIAEHRRGGRFRLTARLPLPEVQ
jgi:two-component system sensor histidine kinase DesK